MKRLLFPVAAITLLGAGCARLTPDLPGTDDATPRDQTPSVREAERPHAGLGTEVISRAWNDGKADRCVFELAYPQFRPREIAGTKEDTTWQNANRELERAALSGLIPTSTDGTFDLKRGADSYIEGCRAELEDLSKTLGKSETSYMQYTQSAGYTVELLQNGLASILFDGYSYSGGAHGLPWIRGETLTIPEGRRLALGDLIQPEQLKPFMQMVRRELVDEWGDALFPEADGAMSAFVADTNPMTEEERVEFSAYDDFYLTPQGFVFYWNVYDVAPYAAGHQTVLVPYRTVADWLLNSPITPLVRSSLSP